MTPGTDRILRKPAPDRGLADRRHEPSVDGLALDVRDAQPGQGQPTQARELASQGLDLNDHLGGERPSGARAEGPPPSLTGASQRTASATCRRSEAWCRDGPRSPGSPDLRPRTARSSRGRLLDTEMYIAGL